MARRKSPGPPKYRLHKARNLAVVTIDGKDRYLGKYGSAESRKLYAKLIAGAEKPPEPQERPQANIDLMIGELSLLYVQYASTYYVKNGQPTAQLQRVKNACAALNRLHAAEFVSTFSPLKLKALQQTLAATPDQRMVKRRNPRNADDQQDDQPPAEPPRTLSRRYINSLVQCIVRMFKWAASEELAPASVYSSLATVEGLKVGRTSARESAKVTPVDEQIVSDTLKHLPQNAADMVRLISLSGMRPGELIAMRAGEVTRHESGPWEYRPASHKSEHHDVERVVFIGPQGQAVLAPWIENIDPAAHVFSPDRLTPQDAPGDPFDKDTFRQLIQRVCRRHNVELWAPNQLRHLHATRVRQRFGLDGAQVVLGHTKADVTQIYAEKNQKLAAEIQAEIG